ncbi:periplasmic heavy metal sensor [Herbaspirillum sp. HC18]|nr:periplasmic heavy metal sensor [Herbaspirillum sp. HC18]
MNRPLWKWLLAISLSLNLGMLAAVAWNAAGTPPAKQDGQDLTAHLNLTEEQRRNWSRIEQDFLKDLSSNWREIRSHREALIRQVFSAAPDRAVIDQEQSKIAALQDAQQRRVIAQLLAERELLDERQRAALMSLLLARYAQETTEEERLHRH